MNFPRPIFFICATLCALAQAQEPSPKSSLNFTRDSNAVAILQKALGSISPGLVTDATASGTIVIVAGSDTDKGTITISTLGTDRSLEQIQTAERNQTTVFSTVRSRITDGNSSQSLPLEITVTAQTPYFTWPLISAALNNPDTAFQYVGQKTWMVGVLITSAFGIHTLLGLIFRISRLLHSGMSGLMQCPISLANYLTSTGKAVVLHPVFPSRFTIRTIGTSRACSTPS